MSRTWGAGGGRRGAARRGAAVGGGGRRRRRGVGMNAEATQRCGAACRRIAWAQARRQQQGRVRNVQRQA